MKKDIIKIKYINSYIPDCDCSPQTTEEPIYGKPGEKYVMKKNFYSDNLDPVVNPDPKPDWNIYGYWIGSGSKLKAHNAYWPFPALRNCTPKNFILKLVFTPLDHIIYTYMIYILMFLTLSVPGGFPAKTK